MANRSPFAILASSTWLALCLITACNAALGIEEATPRATNGSAGTSGSSTFVGPAPTHYAVAGTCIDPVSAACSDCLTASCPATPQADPQTECLETKECRSYMLGYSTCIGKGCNAP